MKKTYISPSIDAMEGESESLLGVSGVYSEDRGISYGGVDEDGSIEASSRRRSSWDEDD